MKTLIAVLLLAVAGRAAAQQMPGPTTAPTVVPTAGQYIQTIFRDPTHPKLSVSALWTMKLNPDGAVTDAAIVYHVGDKNDTLWPQTLIDHGVPPISYTLMEAGGGGNTHSGFVHFGPSINVAPTVLGPVVALLNKAGGNYATIGGLLVDPDGSGLKIGIGWKGTVIDNGAMVPLNQIRFPPRYTTGYTYKFK